MRLAILTSHPIQYQAPLFRELAKRADLTVYFAHRATQADQAKAGFGVEFEWDVDLLSGYEHVFLRNVARQPGLDRFTGCDTPEIGDRLGGSHFDALVINGWHRKSFIQALIGAKRRGIPVLVRGDSQLGTPRTRLKMAAKDLAYRAFLRAFDAALYVGQRSREYWTHYRYPPQRLFYSPHCVDIEWFSRRATTAARTALRTRLGISAETKIALFAGKLVPFKRPHDLISSMAQLKAKGRRVGVLVAGSGPLQPGLAQVARENGVPYYCLGFCNQTDIPSAYAAADLLVLPSDGRETWGLVANEALASGTPIVVSDRVGCAPDLAGDGTAGRTFPLGNIEALTEVMDDLLKQPPSAAAIAAKSRAHSVAAAADGIVNAVSFVRDRRRVAPR